MDVYVLSTKYPKLISFTNLKIEIDDIVINGLSITPMLGRNLSVQISLKFRSNLLSVPGESTKATVREGVVLQKAEARRPRIISASSSFLGSILLILL